MIGKLLPIELYSTWTLPGFHVNSTWCKPFGANRCSHKVRMCLSIISLMVS